MTELIHRADGPQYLTGMCVFKEVQKTRRSFASVPQLYICQRSRPCCRRHQRDSDPERERVREPRLDHCDETRCESSLE